MNNTPYHYTSFDKIYLVYIFFYANLFISPLFNILPFSFWKIFTVICFLFGLFYYKRNTKINNIFVYVFLLTVFLSCIPVLIYDDLNPLAHNSSFLLVTGLFCFFKREYIRPFVTSSTVFICIVIAGAWIGFIYALLGGSPNFEYIGPGSSRSHYIYLTTSVPDGAIFGRFIRPGGIYDEPGSLSSFICSICLMRVIDKRDDRKTLAVMIAGFITMSLFHLVIMFFYSLYFIQRYRRKKETLIILLSLLLIIIILIVIFYDVVELFLFSRLRIDSTGSLVGNTRRGLTENALQEINIRSFFLGLGRDIYYNSLYYANMVGQNQFSPLVYYGILVSWYYYIFLAVIFIIGILKLRLLFIFISMGLVFFPHPYPDVISYSFYFVLFFFIAINLGLYKNTTT